MTAWNPKRCKNCGRTVWEQMGQYKGEWVRTDIYFHHHNGSEYCYPYTRAEVDDDNPRQDYFYVPEPEPEYECDRR